MHRRAGIGTFPFYTGTSYIMSLFGKSLPDKIGFSGFYDSDIIHVDILYEKPCTHTIIGQCTTDIPQTFFVTVKQIHGLVSRIVVLTLQSSRPIVNITVVRSHRIHLRVFDHTQIFFRSRIIAKLGMFLLPQLSFRTQSILLINDFHSGNPVHPHREFAAIERRLSDIRNRTAPAFGKHFLRLSHNSGLIGNITQKIAFEQWSYRLQLFTPQ